MSVEAEFPSADPGAMPHDYDWVETDWDTALNITADKLVEIYKRDGSDAMSVYCCAKATNEDNYLLQKIFRTQFRTNNVDHCTRLCHAGSVVALQQAVGSSAMSNTAAQVIQNDVFIVTGSNTSENHPIIALQMKEAVEKYGAKMIVVDPRRIDLVDFAELWLPLKPGTNVPLFTAMAHVIVTENLVNHDFINDRTEGYTEFLATLEKFTPEYAEEVSGVPAEDIRKAARLYAKAKNGRHLLGHGHFAAFTRNGQRVGAHPSGLSHRSHRTRWHRTQPSARTKQRAGRQRYGRHAVPLSRLHARG